MRLSATLMALLMTAFFSGSFAADLGSIEENQNITIKRTGPGYSLGLVLTAMGDDDKERNGVESGALVLHVIEESSAEKAGLEKDDVLVAVDDFEIADLDELQERYADIDEEKEVVLTYLRDGEKNTARLSFKPFDYQTVSISGTEGDDGEFNWHFFRKGEKDELSWATSDIAEVEVVGGLAPFGHGHKLRGYVSGDSKGGFLGVEAKNVSGQLAEYFEVEHGVLLEKVVEDSPAEKAGLMAGDVITSINDRVIKDYKDLVRTLNYFNPEETVTIEYTRKGSQKSTKATLGEKKVKSNVFFSGSGMPKPAAVPKVKAFMSHPEKARLLKVFIL